MRVLIAPECTNLSTLFLEIYGPFLGVSPGEGKRVKSTGRVAEQTEKTVDPVLDRIHVDGLRLATYSNPYFIRDRRRYLALRL